MRQTPNIDKLDPNLAKFLMDIEAPKCTKSRTDKPEPILDSPKIDKQEPKRAIPRKDIDEPRCT